MKKLILLAIFVVTVFSSLAFSSAKSEINTENFEKRFECTIIIKDYDHTGRVVRTTHYHTNGTCDSLQRMIASE